MGLANGHPNGYTINLVGESVHHQLIFFMGRKSSSKGQSQHPASASPQEKARSLFAPIAIGGAVLLAAIGLMVYSGGGGGAIEPQATATAQNMTPVEPAYAKFGPHKQAVLPPFPFDTEPPIRPQQVINAAYTFAAEHPEVLAYVPCYCGCERAGHRGNDDCFVMARAANGDVTRWEPHGMT
jgi:Protein of unknown function with PCYCGC motif